MEDAKRFSDVVASTLGLDFDRGDKLVVKNMKFVTEDLSAAEAVIRSRENREIIKNIVKYLFITYENYYICLYLD